MFRPTFTRRAIFSPVPLLQPFKAPPAPSSTPIPRPVISLLQRIVHYNEEDECLPVFDLSSGKQVGETFYPAGTREIVTEVPMQVQGAEYLKQLKEAGVEVAEWKTGLLENELAGEMKGLDGRRAEVRLVASLGGKNVVEEEEVEGGEEEVAAPQTINIRVTAGRKDANELYDEEDDDDHSQTISLSFSANPSQATSAEEDDVPSSTDGLQTLTFVVDPAPAHDHEEPLAYDGSNFEEAPTDAWSAPSYKRRDPLRCPPAFSEPSTTYRGGNATLSTYRASPSTLKVAQKAIEGRKKAYEGETRWWDALDAKKALRERAGKEVEESSRGKTRGMVKAWKAGKTTPREGENM